MEIYQKPYNIFAVSEAFGIRIMLYWILCCVLIVFYYLFIYFLKHAAAAELSPKCALMGEVYNRFQKGVTSIVVSYGGSSAVCIANGDSAVLLHNIAVGVYFVMLLTCILWV